MVSDPTRHPFGPGSGDDEAGKAQRSEGGGEDWLPSPVSMPSTPLSTTRARYFTAFSSPSSSHASRKPFTRWSLATAAISPLQAVVLTVMGVTLVGLLALMRVVGQWEQIGLDIHRFSFYSSSFPAIQHLPLPPPSEANQRRANAVKQAARHAWAGYTRTALGADELLPVSNGPSQRWGGYAVTLIDSLDTLWIMDLKDEFRTAAKYVHAMNFSTIDRPISFFETTIRVIGGLVSAYEFSGDTQLLDKAVTMADMLQPAYLSLSGFPYHKISLENGHGFSPERHPGQCILAEVGSVQLEFGKLTYLANNHDYLDRAYDVIKKLTKNKPPVPGLYPFALDVDGGDYANVTASMGSKSDSFYEYLLKMYILFGDMHPFGDMYLESIDAVKKHLVKSVPFHDDMAFLATLHPNNETTNEFDHLTCFAPGMLAMGSRVFSRPDDLELAKQLMKTCVHLYRTTTTGLSLEKVQFFTPAEFVDLTQEAPPDTVAKLRRR
ncbi:hypothetical protein H4R35_006244, partial [Dimargaris xerosporica]